MISRETPAGGDPEVGVPPGPAERLLGLCRDMGVAVSWQTAGVLVALLDAIALEPQNLTAIGDVSTGVERHLADSLAGLLVPAVRSAVTLVDVGSGGGFPGLPLAAARPDLSVTLLESEGRKADWLRRASARFPNVRVVSARSEELAAAERERWSCATARALGPLPVVLELAAPLVEVGGAVVVWRGERDPGEEEAAARAAAELGLEPEAVLAVTPFPGARRHLHPYRKVVPTPARFPRRPGRAAKRPLA
jgi:16S rRNA (guanine527-N7)-methyltransferase